MLIRDIVSVLGLLGCLGEKFARTSTTPNIFERLRNLTEFLQDLPFLRAGDLKKAQNIATV